MSAYCVRCRGRRQMQGAKAVVLRNQKRTTTAQKGTCPSCKGTMYRIVK